MSVAQALTNDVIGFSKCLLNEGCLLYNVFTGIWQRLFMPFGLQSSDGYAHIALINHGLMNNNTK